MSKIRQLDDILSNKIAAGEVVERPCSVVKELVENSIDASGSKIDVMIEEGGASLIQVSDNGEGMDHEDAVLCFSTHATSKIKNDKDLFNITTLGFRGEAIPSIASISHFELETNNGEQSTKVIYEFGKHIETSNCSMQRGTKITVTKFFQNVPARLKYLKSANTESNQIQQYIERIALAHPEISFHLYIDHKLTFATNGHNNLLEVISSIYGIQVARNMIEIHNETEEFEIDGYISKIDTNRASKSNIMTLVNHRYVKNMMSIDAVNEAYRQYLFDNRYPIAVININVDPYLVDVNVHPSKMEVRFSKEYELKELIYNTVVETLASIDLKYQAIHKATEKETFKVDYSKINEEPVTIDEYIADNELTYVVKEPAQTYEVKKEEIQPVVIKEEVKKMAEKIHVKGQVLGTYIIGENEKGMYLIDQHAAKERVNYEHFKKQYESLDFSMQPLIVPIQLEYPLSEFNIIEERKELLSKVGVYLEVFGDHGYIVRSLPLWMKNIDETIFIEEMIHEVLSKNKLDVVKLQDHAIATLACKASLKGNTYLSNADMQTVVDQLMCCENPYVCPHGRPTIIFYSEYEIEKLFKRVI